MKVADRYSNGLAVGLPKVSVATTTYNHENFIGEAIESVLMQDTDFPVEMVIGEDCSMDGTRRVIEDYVRRYPGFIRMIAYRRNVGAARNAVRTIGRCCGEYVALLDGDDFWTSPHKLRRQVETLDARPEFSLCFHAVNRMRDGRIIQAIVRPTGHRSVYRLADLAHWINISTSSMMFRREALPEFPPWYSDVTQGDWAMQVMLAERGNIVYLPKVMATHRLHTSNMWAGRERPRSEVLREQITEVEAFRQHIGEAHREPFRRSQRRRHYELVHACLDEGRVDEARAVMGAFEGWKYDPRVEVLEPWLVLFHLKAPGPYRRLGLNAVYLNRRLRNLWGRLSRPILDREAFQAPAVPRK